MKKLLVLLLFLPTLAGINTLTSGYRVPANSSLRIYANDGTTQGACYTIQNNNVTNDVFVPTKSAAEWASFLTNTPAFVSKTLCQPLSCLEIKNTMGSPADGYYTIDSDGAGANASYSAYCDMTVDGGGWTRIFYHHIQGGYFPSVASATTYNVGTPSADLYSVLNKIPDFISSGKYKFRQTWPGFTKKNIWIQTTNPLDDVDPAGVVPLAVNAYSQSKLLNWGGLELGNGTHGPGNSNSSLLDGSIEHGNWFFAIGQTAAWSNPPGIPSDPMISGGGVSATALWIKDEGTYTRYNSCKDILDSGASTGNGIYTIDPGSIGSPIPVYCDMTSDGGGWTRVFYHTVSGGVLFADDTQAKNYNPFSPLSTDRYSILFRIASFQRSGQYELKIDWPGSGSSIRNWWTQTSNFTTSAISGYSPVSIQTTANGWGGLEISTTGGGGSESLADGTVGSSSWWYAIGQKLPWGTDPGTPSSSDVSAVGVPAAELWVK